MHIYFDPFRSDELLEVQVSGETLIVNGTPLDLSGVDDGTSLAHDLLECPWLAADIRRECGVLHVRLRLPHGADAPDTVRFPAPVAMKGDGRVPLPTDAQPQVG